MIVSHLLLILQKKYSFISLCLKPEMWQKVAKFKGAEYFRKALRTFPPLFLNFFLLSNVTKGKSLRVRGHGNSIVLLEAYFCGLNDPLFFYMGCGVGKVRVQCMSRCSSAVLEASVVVQPVVVVLVLEGFREVRPWSVSLGGIL